MNLRVSEEAGAMARDAAALLPPKTAHRGNLWLLEEPLTALFCSQRCPGDLIIQTTTLPGACGKPGSQLSAVSRRLWSGSACACCYGESSLWSSAPPAVSATYASQGLSIL